MKMKIRTIARTTRNFFDLKLEKITNFDRFMEITGLNSQEIV